jgi:surface protein
MKGKMMGKTRKLLSVLLALALVGMVPVSPVFAAEAEAEDATVATTTESGATDAEPANSDEPGLPAVQDGGGIISPSAAALVEPQATAAKIVLQAQKAGELKIFNKWNPTIIVTQGNTDTAVSGGTISLTVSQDETITVSEFEPDKTFRSWRSSESAFVSGVSCAITAMPAMSAFTNDPEGTIAGDYFFCGFNNSGSLTSLPAGSFNTSNITIAGRNFFSHFNRYGSLTSLPTGSFDTSNITTVGDYFFYAFNAGGDLTSLPAGSFGTSGITTAGYAFFCGFNNSGSLTSLPAGSFDASNITTVGDSFFSGFNYYGSLTSLPSSFRLPQAPTSINATGYCSYMFSNSALTRGNEQAPLYFAAAASYAFTGTDIDPASPSIGTTVYVNGDLDSVSTPHYMTGSTSPDSVTGVFNGTANNPTALGLQQYMFIEVVPADELGATPKTIKVPVAWDPSAEDYDPERIEEQTFVYYYTAQLPANVTDPLGANSRNWISVTVNRKTYINDWIDLPYYSHNKQYANRSEVASAAYESTQSLYYSDSFWQWDSRANFSDDTAKFLLMLESAASQKDAIYHAYQALNLEGIELYNYDGKDVAGHDIAMDPDQDNRVGYAFATKEVELGGNPCNLVFITIRGTEGDTEWASNFNLVDMDVILHGGNHRGFDIAKEQVYARLQTYMAQIDNGYETKMIISGHSRGAAVANLLAAKLDYDVTFAPPRKNIFAYTFATPNTYSMTIPPQGGNYDNIFNFVNPTDPVTGLPPGALGFWKYGTTIALPDTYGSHLMDDFGLPVNTHFPGVDQAYRMMTGNTIGTLISNIEGTLGTVQSKVYAHAQEVYYAWMMAVNPVTSGYWSTEVFNGIYARVSCPVDVKVYDAEDNLVASIKDNEVVLDVAGDPLYCWALNDEKHFYIASDDEYRLEIVATAGGVMKYYAAASNACSPEPLDEVEFTSVSLQKGKSFTSDLLADVSDIELFVTEGDEKTASVGHDGRETPLAGGHDEDTDVVGNGTLTRHAGDVRTETAVQASRKTFPDASQVSTVIVAFSHNFPDALAASALAGATGAPLLLSATDSLDAVTLDELKRLSPAKVYIVGGEGVISAAVLSELQALPSTPQVSRLGGGDRYATARLIAEEALRNGAPTTEVFLATGKNFPDALAVSPFAAYRKVPVLLTEPGALSSDAKAFIAENNVKKVTIIGGEAVVSAEVFSELESMGVGVSRLFGDERYATARVATEALTSHYGMNPTLVGVATGDNFPDALAGGVALGIRGGVMALTPTGTLNANAEAVLSALKANLPDVEIFGGTAAVASEVEFAVRQALGF